MTMRNRFAPHIDTTDLDGLIESNPRWGFSNLDLIAERGNAFLVQEWKRPEESIKEGQRILLRALARCPGFTVLLVTGEQDEHGTRVHEVRQIMGWAEDRVDTARKVGDTLDDLRAFVRAWYLENNYA